MNLVNAYCFVCAYGFLALYTTVKHLHLTPTVAAEFTPVWFNFSASFSAIFAAVFAADSAASLQQLCWNSCNSIWDVLWSFEN